MQIHSIFKNCFGDIFYFQHCNTKKNRNFPTTRISVFNRWGQKLFDAFVSDAPWDGTYNDKFVPTGPYLGATEKVWRASALRRQGEDV